MFYDAIGAQLPPAAHKLNFESVEKMYSTCLTVCKDFDPMQTEVRTEQRGQSLHFLYVPEDKYMRVQVFATAQAHLPFKSFLCWPDKILEMGYAGVGSDAKMFQKVHRQYLDVISGKRSWRLVESDAPRHLTHLDRNDIPTSRNHLLYEMNRLMEKGRDSFFARDSASTATTLADKQLYGRRYYHLSNFLSRVKLDGFNDVILSDEILKNLRDRYVHLTSNLSMLVHSCWSEEDEGKHLKWIFRVLDPKADFMDEKNLEVDSETILPQWRDYVRTMSKVMPYEGDDRKIIWPDDPLGIGGWKDV